MTEEQQLQSEIAGYTGGLVMPADSMGAFRAGLAAYFNLLVNSDFNKLIFILYRLDISEKKLKQLLGGAPQTDAGILIASLVIERQLQKIALRKQYRQDDNNIAEEDKW